MSRPGILLIKIAAPCMCPLRMLLLGTFQRILCFIRMTITQHWHENSERPVIAAMLLTASRDEPYQAPAAVLFDEQGDARWNYALSLLPVPASY